MSQLVALSVSIGVLGGVATWLYLTAGLLIWAGFIAWACYFHSGADGAALKNTIVCNAFGSFCAWVAALIILSFPMADTLGLPVWAAIVVGLWFAWLTNSADELAAEQKKEEVLKEDYKKKVAQAVNLDALRKQREQVQQYVTQLEKQLPSKAEMDALLSDINQAGLGRSLVFDLFRPGQVNVKEYYAELPIAVRVTGRQGMGVTLMRLSEGERVISCFPVSDEGEDEETAENIND